MDLTRATAEEIGSALDRAGITWGLDDDGDVRVRFRSTQQPWVDAVFYELKPDFSIRGKFLDGRVTSSANGLETWEVSPSSGYKPTAVAQKVVTVYLMPRAGGIGVQVHAAFVPMSDQRKFHIRVVPSSSQVNRIEMRNPGYVGRGDGLQFWISSGMTGNNVDERVFVERMQEIASVGLAMFDGTFTGRLYSTDI